MAVSFFGLGIFLFSRFQASLMDTLDATLQIAVSQTISAMNAETDSPLRLFQPPKSAAEGFAMRLLSQDGQLRDFYGDDETVGAYF